MEPSNSGHFRDGHFVHCSEVVSFSECPLSEAPLYTWEAQLVGQLPLCGASELMLIMMLFVDDVCC